MNKIELVTKMAEKSGLTKKDSEIALKAFISTIEDTLANRDKVQLVGFGTFEAKKRAERKGKNPKTGAEIIIPACFAPTFKAGKELKESVNK